MQQSTRPSRPVRARRVAVVSGLAALAFLAAACVTPTPTPVNYRVCPTATSGNVQVAVVVQDAPTATRVVCVVVPAGSDSLDALNARATRIGAPAPRVEGGFVCAIDGNPAAPACGDSTPEGFSYWNFWLGGTTWTSAPIGAGDRLVTQGSVDGWDFGTWDFATTFPAAPTTASDFATLTD